MDNATTLNIVFYTTKKHPMRSHRNIHGIKVNVLIRPEDVFHWAFQSIFKYTINGKKLRVLEHSTYLQSLNKFSPNPSVNVDEVVLV